MRLSLIFSILISLPLLAQNYSRFVIIQDSGTRIEGTNGSIADSLFNGIDENGKNFSTPINDINKFYIAGSSKTLTMGALGFLSGLAIGLSIDYNNSTSSFRGNTLVIGIFSAIGMLVGGIVGSNSYYWKTIDINTFKQHPKIQETSFLLIQFNINL